MSWHSVAELMNDRMIFKSVVYFYVITIVTVCLLWVVSRGMFIYSKDETFVAVSFLGIGALAIVCLSQAVFHSGISLFAIHWFFVLTFFFIVPFIQHLGNLFLHDVESDNLLTGNVLILAWCLVYLFSYQYAVQRTRACSRGMPLLLKKRIDLRLPKGRLCFLTAMSIVAACWLLIVAGPGSFLTRGSYNAFVGRLGGWGPLTLLITYYLRPLLFCILVLFVGVLRLLGKGKRTPILWLCFFLSFLVNVLVNNPVSYPRFMFFCMVFGLCVLVSLRRLKPSLIYLYVLLLGLPLSHFVNIFREVHPKLWQGLIFDGDRSLLFSGNFDAYENFIHTINYVADSGIVFGRQLGGAFVFFVPRSFWPGKPLGSGYFIGEFLAEKFAITHLNIANPLISEMYLNFHVLGVVVGAVLYGLVTGWLDKHYWLLIKGRDIQQDNAQQGVPFYQLLYPFLLGLYLFHLRGDFMSSFAYAVGFVLAFLTVVIFLKLRISDEVKNGATFENCHHNLLF